MSFCLRKCIFAASLLCLAVSSGAVTKGSVRCEGKAVAGVKVSDGVNIVTTDRNGGFVLPDDQNAGRFVFICTPSGYVSSTMPGKDCFYMELSASRKNYDFTLRRNSMDDNNHRVIVVADPQISDEDDLKPLVGRIDDIASISADGSGIYTFGISLGDMVGWNHSLYPRINKIFGASLIQWRNVMGNHDMTNYGRSFETSTTDYENAYGPAYYSFNVGKVHYVVLNDNFFVGKDWYYIGYLPERQLSWLEKDLAYVPKGSEIVLCMHIPTQLYHVDTKAFSYPYISEMMCNNTALYKIVDGYQTTILSGHMHTNTNVRINDHIVEHNIGGLCGAWWCGTVCIDGCPPGCKVYERHGKEQKWYYKGEGMSRDVQARIYADDPSYPGKVIAHVWDQDADWKVEYMENGSKVCDMTRFEGVDPTAVEQFKDPTRYKISWVGYLKTPNLFEAPYNPEAVNPQVRVTNPFGEVFTYDVK